MRQLRLAIRRFFDQQAAGATSTLFGGDLGEQWARFGDEATRLGGVVVALVNRTFPLFLVPVSRTVLQDLRDLVPVRIRLTRTKGWTIRDRADRVLFSFDLPPVLFYMYAQSDTLTRAGAAMMKEEMFGDLQALVFDGEQPRLVRFVPDEEWFTRLREYAAQSAEPLIADQRSNER